MKKLSLNVKLSLSFALQLVFIIGIGLIGFVALNDVTTTYRHVVKVNLPKEKLLAEIRLAQKDVFVGVQSTSGTDVTPEIVDEYLKSIDDANAKFQKTIEKFDELPLTDAEAALWKNVKENWKPLYEMSKKIVGLAASSSTADHNLREKLKANDFVTLRKNMKNPVEDLREFQVADSDKWSKSAEESSTHAKLFMNISMAVGVILSFIAAVYLIVHLRRLLTRITENLSKDAEQVAMAAKNISTASVELSTSVSEQSSAIHQTSAAIEEISSMIGKTADNANRSREISDESQNTVKEGQELIQQMLRAIQEIDQSNAKINAEIDHSNKEIKDIVKVISEIGVKTQVINDIVFQTKLLSFNASVEAARAGEHGKGFAVVAEEVGNLAQMSGNAAKEISGMLDGGIAKVEGIVSNSTSRVEGLIRMGKEKVSSGMELAKRCDAAFKAIVSKTAEVSDLVGEISSATQEQSSGVGEVSKAIAQLNESTQQNNTVSENSAVSAQQLTSQAEALATVVSELNTVVNGESNTIGHQQDLHEVRANRKHSSLDQGHSEAA